MINLPPTAALKRVVLIATMIVGIPAGGFAQGLPIPGMPATVPSGLASPLGSTMRRPSMNGTASGMTPMQPNLNGTALGTIEYALGSLGQPQSPALGSITPCPLIDITGAASASASVLMPAPPSGLSPILTSPMVTPQMVAPPVAAPQYLIIPIATPQIVVPQFGTPQVVSPTGPSTGAAPTAALPPVPTTITSAFGTSTTIDTCAPSILGESATPPPSTTIGGATYSDAVIPLQATEAAGGGGLSPMVDVPPPSLFTPGVAAPAQ
jgi:hypothetical protein